MAISDLCVKVKKEAFFISYNHIKTYMVLKEARNQVQVTPEQPGGAV